MTRCKAIISKSKDNIRQCSRTGEAVMANGYCLQHQVIAYRDILEELNRLEKELLGKKKLGHTPVHPLLQEIEALKLRMRNTEDICRRDGECAMALQNLLVELSMLPIRPGSTVSKTIHNIESLASGSSPAGAEADRLNREYEVSRRTVIQANAEQAETRRELLKLQEQKARVEQELASEMEALRAQQAQASQGLKESNQAAQNVANEIHSMNAAQSQTPQGIRIYELEQERDKFKAMFEELRSREVVIQKKLEAESRAMEEIKAATIKLKNEYDQRLQQQHDELVAQINGGKEVLTNREAELVEQNKVLEEQLQAAVKQMELIKHAVADNLKAQIDVNAAPNDFAREFLRLNADMKRKNEKQAHLEQELQMVRETLATLTEKFNNEKAAMNAKTRKQVEGLERKVSMLRKEIDMTEESARECATARSQLEMKSLNQYNMLNEQLKQTSAELIRVRTQLSQIEFSANERARLAESAFKSRGAALEMEYKNREAELSADHQRRLKVLETDFMHKHAQAREQLNQLNHTREQMKYREKQFAESEKRLQDEIGRMRKDRSEFDMLVQKLKSKHADAMASQAAFTQLEQDANRRLRECQNKVETVRASTNDELSRLTEKLRRSDEMYRSALSNLDVCAAKRDKLITETQMLRQENDRLKDKTAHLKSDMEAMRAAHEVELNKLRQLAAEMKTQMKVDASKMQDMVRVHDHIKDTLEEEKRHRKAQDELERRLRDAEMVAEKLQRQRDLDTSTIANLQQTVQVCRTERKILEQNTIESNDRIREYKQKETELAQSLRDTSTAIKEAALQQESRRRQENARHHLKEQQLQQQAAMMQKQLQSAQRQMENQRQTTMTVQDELLRSNIEHAMQLESLFQAKKPVAPRKVALDLSQL